jgi:hypothetical protein
MNLDEAQKKKVTEWIAQGLKLSDIQRRLDAEMGVRLTYMEVRFLVDDLKLTPKDPEPPKPVELPVNKAVAEPNAPAGTSEQDEGTGGLLSEKEELPPPGAGKVKVKVDQIARPGAIVSGSVTFSDGKGADWYLDQMGRLGLSPKEQGYKPSAADVQVFQMELQSQLAKIGF